MKMETCYHHRSFSTPTVVLVLAVLAVAIGCNDSATADPAEGTAGAGAASKKAAADEAGKDTNDEQDADDKQDAEANVVDADQHPFAQRQPAPSLDGGVQWLNTAGPLDIKDLRGKFVLLDFWTYCCINCMHILPELKKLEHAYPNNVVVIGVHSAKFDTEKGSDNIRQAVLRYEIEHPVVNDANHVIWNKYGVTGWPALRVVDPEGNLVAGHGGEITFDALDGFFKQVLPYYKKHKLLDESPVRFDLERDRVKAGPLRFPGKVLADEASNRLFISDSGHNRIVVADLVGKLIETIGSGRIGRDDGPYDKAAFDHPHGLALRGETLYVADTENHLIRKINLASKEVTTVAGVGSQRRDRLWPGAVVDPVQGLQVPDRWVGPPKETAISSPWALWVHDEQLYIAMAGPHQIWRMSLDEAEIGPYAGNGREDIVDGPLLPQFPGEEGFSSFAQPSGLAGNGQWLYVADTEGSSIRAVPFDQAKEVKTIVGTSQLPGGRLFIFGDRDGQGLLKSKGFLQDADDTTGPLLQHAIGIAYHDGQLYVADTYNNKVKRIDPDKQTCTTLAGTGQPGLSDNPAQFDEPAGIAYASGKLYVADTNNHAIRVIDLNVKHKVSTLTIDGLSPPSPPKQKKQPDFAGAPQVAVPPASVKPKDGKITLAIDLNLPFGWKLNTLGPMHYLVQAKGASGPIDRSAIGKAVWPAEADRKMKFNIALPLTADGGEDQLAVALRYFYCQDGAEGLCKVGSVVWNVPVKISADAESDTVVLEYKVE